MRMTTMHDPNAPAAAIIDPSPQALRDIFQELAAHTAPACAGCRVPPLCCSPDQCRITQSMAQDEFHVDLTPLIVPDSPLPFLGPQGCVVPPHLRPTCSVHVCGQHLSKDSDWTRRYWALREDAGDALDAHISTLA